MYHFLHIHKGKVTQDQYTQNTPETVIMVRGMSRSYRSWLGLEKELSEQFDVICVDLPGVGLSKDEELLFLLAPVTAHTAKDRGAIVQCMS